jgi:hypothetical protein
LLIEAGADVNAQCEYYTSRKDGSRTAIMLAARQRLSDVVPALLAKGADVNARNSLGATNLIVAAGEGDPMVVQALLANGAEVNAASNDGRTALMRAAGGETSILQALLAKGAVVNARDKDGGTTLMWAAWTGQTENVRVLLANGAEVNAARNDGWTALMLAAIGSAGPFAPSSTGRRCQRQEQGRADRADACYRSWPSIHGGGADREVRHRCGSEEVTRLNPTVAQMMFPRRLPT